MISCPIRDEDGNPKRLQEIVHSDFTQLKKYNEGYSVEYKSRFNNDVKNALPKVISSFANTEGGWIFIGITDEDNNHQAIDIDFPGDYSQAIGEKIAEKVSPIPRFEAHFVCNPVADKRGVIVICVEEGYETPYVAAGSIYTRSGSSSKKAIPAEDAATIRSLEKKRLRFEGERNSFYKRELYYPPFGNPDGRISNSFPMVSIYLYRLFASNVWPTNELLDQARNSVEHLLSHEKVDDGFSVQETPRSLVIRHGRMNSMDNVNNAIELFHNGSLKAHIPLLILQGNKRSEALRRLKILDDIHNENRFAAVDGCFQMGNVLNIARLLDSLIEENPLCGSLDDYLLGFEFENCNGISIYCANRHYDNYVKEKGIPFFTGSSFFSKDIKLRDSFEFYNTSSVEGTACAVLFEAMGFAWRTHDVDRHEKDLNIVFGD